MSDTTVRRRFLRQFAGLEKYSRPVAWIIAGSFVLQIAISIWLGHLLLNMPLTIWTGLGVALLALFIGTRLRGLNNIIHECSHASFAKDRQDNVTIGSFCASMVLSCYHDYRDEHLTHHAHLGDYSKDMDLHGIEDLRLHDPLDRKTILRHILTPLFLQHLRYYLGANMSARDGMIFLALKAALLLGTGVGLALAPWTTLWMVVVPYTLIYSTLNYWTDCLDHAGLVPTDNDLEGSRNVLAPALLRAIFFPRNDCYHLVHHLFPNIPARHLQQSHATLLTDPIYRSTPNATQPVFALFQGPAQPESQNGMKPIDELNKIG